VLLYNVKTGIIRVAHQFSVWLISLRSVTVYWNHNYSLQLVLDKSY